VAQRDADGLERVEGGGMAALLVVAVVLIAIVVLFLLFKFNLFNGGTSNDIRQTQPAWPVSAAIARAGRY